ncbi:MAG: hypothetical protein HYZ28_11565 [Myxococcales bacterium]|nr:hypothetical protein [Myxococcales bacterium]
MKPSFELFHLIADSGSARVRRRVVELGLESRLRFRNVGFEEAQQALEDRGGKGVPALWDGERLLEGPDAVIERLESLARRS